MACGYHKVCRKYNLQATCHVNNRWDFLVSGDDPLAFSRIFSLVNSLTPPCQKETKQEKKSQPRRRSSYLHSARVFWPSYRHHIRRSGDQDKVSVAVPTRPRGAGLPRPTSPPPFNEASSLQVAFFFQNTPSRFKLLLLIIFYTMFDHSTYSKY
jgi:hypothetical protein